MGGNNGKKCNKQQFDLIAIKNCAAPGASFLAPIMKQTEAAVSPRGAVAELRIPWGHYCVKRCQLNEEVIEIDSWKIFLISFFHELKKHSLCTSCQCWLTAYVHLQEIHKVYPVSAEEKTTRFCVLSHCLFIDV